MTNYKIKVMYDGTKYKGWQRQVSTDQTIQGKIEGVLSKMVDSTVEIQGAGRTDAGVHAYAQIANFQLDTNYTPKEIMEYLNQYLPEDISVINCRRVNDRFHSRLLAKGKIYRYRIWNHSDKPVFERKYVYQLADHFDIELMKEAAAVLCGTHDFQSFTSAKKGKKSTIRFIESIQIEQLGKELVITINGNGFLYNMVRIMVGTLMEVGMKKRSVESVRDLLEAKDRSQAGYLAPAKGLALMEIYY